ncbi:MAG: hypothetical protein JJ974_06855 [Phycisphaerales bacterium]|nr:hypothetical protein [Phycisphaerales bacterium]
MEYGPVAPSWIVLPLAMIALLIVAAHLLVLREHAIGKMPESRRQIRMITGWVMMFTIPLIAYGFGIVSPANQQEFVLAWTCIVGLLCGIILLACVDAFNSVRLARKQTKALRAEFREILFRRNQSGAPIVHPEHDG